ncbi:ribosome biogenesis GTPase Der [Gaopeijia maritima]|uniref:ribosome biogenesis GTPase Der n=1 Tax=Gaopeijia maritima TaxID=3119007 RepID=UPI00324778EE
MTLPVVAVVGRPNVGKSTLFNRVIGRRLAIVDDQPGVTRDRNFSPADWAGRHFYIVDTGGVIEDSDRPMDRLVREQAEVAIREADVLVLVTDGKEGLHPLDQKVAEMLRSSGKPVVLAVNKMDNLPRDPAHHEFWELGLGEPHAVSAGSGKGSGDLLDRIVELLPAADALPDDPTQIRVAVVGKPNVGKSSLVNRLFGEERVVVSDEAGTTRDPVDSTMAYHGRNLVFVDTAGLRRQSKVKEDLEYYSYVRTERVVRDADVCLMLIDGTQGISHQDLRIMEQAWEAGAGVVLVVNKWDLVEKDGFTADLMVKAMRERTPFLQWVPVLFASALTGQRVRKALDMVLEAEAQRQRRIDTSDVNDVLQRLVGRQPPPHSRGRPVKIRYGTQVRVAPPTFVLFSNLPREVPAHYLRYIHNGFRDAWEFTGTPIRIFFRESNTS